MSERTNPADVIAIPINPVLSEALSVDWVDSLYVQLEEHSPDMAAHSIHVAIIACELAEVSGLDSQYQSALTKAGLLHDVAKIRVSQEGLTVPYSKLEARDKVELIEHSVNSFEMIRPHDELTSLIVVSHHEYQGDYSWRRNPNRQPPEEFIEKRTPLPEATQKAQILLVIADAADAALTHRAYKGDDWEPPTLDELYDSIASKIPEKFHAYIPAAIQMRAELD